MENGNKYFLPNLSVDVVIVGYRNNILKCLLLKIGEKWLLPGGYIKKDESVKEAAINILKVRTGLENTYLKFLAVFGEKNREFKNLAKEFLKSKNIEWQEDLWLNNRFVSLAYYSLVYLENTHPKVSHLDETFGWFDFENLPEMWMDHKDIVLSTKDQLIKDIQHDYQAHNLLPKEFTMPELHKLHQTILGEKIDRSRFQKKMLATGLYERLPLLQKKTRGRNPYQYKLK